MSEIHRGLGTFAGFRLIADPFMTEPEEDWSGCRSIPRAKRRHAKGIKTRLRIYQVPKKTAYVMDAKFAPAGVPTVVMHPTMIELLKEEAEKIPDKIEPKSFLAPEGEKQKNENPWRFYNPLRLHPIVRPNLFFNTDIP